MEQNEKLRNETSRRKPFVKALVAVLVAALAAFVLMPLTGGKAFAAGTATIEVSSWAELKEALDDPNNGTIVLTDNIAAESTIEINSDVTIKGKDGQTIYQKKRDDGSSYETMFKVTGGNVTFGDNLTLSGKLAEWKCEDVPGETITDPAVFKVIWSNGVDGDNAWSETVENASGTLAHAAPTKTPGEGWTFTGWKWKESADGEAKFTTDGNTDIGYTVPTNLEKNVTMTIVAQWEKGGSGSGNLSYNDGQVFYLENNNNVKMFPVDGASSTNTLVPVTAFIRDGGVYIEKPNNGGDARLNCYVGL